MHVSPDKDRYESWKRGYIKFLFLLYCACVCAMIVLCLCVPGFCDDYQDLVAVTPPES